MPEGVVLSDSITVGQLTFVLRVLVQIISYGGLWLIGTLILAYAPRLAPIATHDVISRHVGASSVTGSTVKWVFSRLRRNSSDPYPPTNLLIVLFLSVTYAAFVALSDIGFLGFYACNVPGKDLYDTPASINTTDAALKSLAQSMVNGSDPNTIRAFRCAASELLHLGGAGDIVVDHCTAWKNGTYGDRSFFSGLNTTDSDVLMPRQLTIHHHPQEARIYLNSYLNSFGTSLNPNVLVTNGMAIDPHEGGLTAVFGVPTIIPDYEVTLEKALGLEVDIACMTTGIISSHIVDSVGSGLDSFATQGNWRKFAGPEYMRDALSKTVDQVRAYWLPFFNGFTPGADGVIYSNDTTQVLSRAANIQSWQLPSGTNSSLLSPANDILDNCSFALQQQLQITNSTTSNAGQMCSFLGIGGSIGTNGTLGIGFNRMVCATATQVNMVTATIAIDASEKISMNITRLPSDLNYIRADIWDTSPTTDGNGTQYTTFEAYERFTLSDNPNGQTQHYIRHEKLYDVDSSYGVGSAGRAISGIGDAVMDWPSSFSTATAYKGLPLLPAAYDTLNFTTGTNMVTFWIAQLGSSLLTNSIGYNGWAGEDATPVRLVSTGGHAGTCYKTPYAVGFAPLLIAACAVVIWSFTMLFGRSIFGTKTVKEAYGGIAPYVGTVCPGAPKETLLVWEHGHQPRLQVVSKGMPVVGDGSDTALSYLKSGPSYP